MVAIASGPDWASSLTAIGTVAVAITAVGIAIWSDWRTGRPLADQRSRHDIEIAEERAIADRRLAQQLAHSDAQLTEERAAADRRLADEIGAAGDRLHQDRLAAQEQEQLAQAYLVQVSPARMNVQQRPNEPARDPDEPVERAVVIIVNHGHYTITRVQAQLIAGNNMVSYDRTEHLSSWFNLPEELRPAGIWEARSGPTNTLTPMDLGLRYTSDVMAVKFLVGSYPVVRWHDRWGTRWEHKQGVVRGINEGEDGW